MGNILSTIQERLKELWYYAQTPQTHDQPAPAPKKKATEYVPPKAVSTEEESRPTPAQQADHDRRLADSIASLRWDIRSSHQDPYILASLTWDQAVGAVGSGWDAVDLQLNLKAHTLSAHMSTYPTHYGEQHAIKPLTPREFHDIAVGLQDPKLAAFETQADWDALFDRDLASLADEIQWEKQRRADELHQKAKQENMLRISIPKEIIAPDMTIRKIELDLMEYSRLPGGDHVQIVRENGRYRSDLLFKKELTDAEAIWLEQRVKQAIEDQSRKTWQSHCWGAKMTVSIVRDGESDIDLEMKYDSAFTSRKTPNIDEILQKYYDLIIDLGKLVRYGADIERK